MLFSKVTALLSLAMSSLVAAYPVPGTCKGDCYARDPAVAKNADGEYYRFTTHDLIGIETADHLNGPWTKVGSVIQGQSVIELTGRADLWAPDVKRVGDVWFCFYSVSTLGSHVSAIGYATSPNMKPGTWTDHGAIVTSQQDSPYNAIDPSLYTGPNGEHWLLWGSYWGNIHTQQVNVDGNKVSRIGSPTQIAYLPRDNHPEEGAFMYRKNGFWYLFMSHGKAGNFDSPETYPEKKAYHIVVCRGESPTGPFFGKFGQACLQGGGHTIYASQDNIFAPGGQGIFHDDAHGDVIYYHYLNRNKGYGVRDATFGWSTIQWNDGWPIVV